MLERADLLHPLEASLGSPFSSDPLSPNPNPLIIVISGSSGVGKDTLIVRPIAASAWSSPPHRALAAPPKSTTRTTSSSRRRCFSGWWSGRSFSGTPSFLGSIFRVPPREIGDEAFEEF
ncbi:hypothetical protein VIGAN_02074400 [Vigna angularis var. angularis]|uniref:Guanylate kinase-like domain-containing protein n=1 Tax=Vigna angularis var. angularis TaxID=157739 RepID=A0A0S3RBG9_PHAAN|nr:hypothetical protein VIGAN_02074400 [Vigna angularis var. angularis]